MLATHEITSITKNGYDCVVEFDLIFEDGERTTGHRATRATKNDPMNLVPCSAYPGFDMALRITEESWQKMQDYSLDVGEEVFSALSEHFGTDETPEDQAEFERRWGK